MENISKKEWILAIAVFMIMLALGLLIKPVIMYDGIKNQKIMTQAIQVIDNPTEFQYEVKTLAGDVFAYGTMKAIDPVSVDALNGNYTVVETITERYTQHSREVCDSRDEDNKCTSWRTEYYETWDRIGSVANRSTKVNYLGVDFDSTLFGLGAIYRVNLDESVSDSYRHLSCHNFIYNSGCDWFDSVGDLRYYYHILPTEFKASVLFGLYEKEVYSNPLNKNDKVLKVYYDQLPDDVIKQQANNVKAGVVVVIVVLILLGVGAYLWVAYIKINLE